MNRRCGCISRRSGIEVCLCVPEAFVNVVDTRVEGAVLSIS